MRKRNAIGSFLPGSVPGKPNRTLLRFANVDRSIRKEVDRYDQKRRRGKQMEKFADMKVRRREFLVTAAGGAAALAAPAFIRNARAASEITIITWETYHEDAWIAEWSEKTSIKVNVIRSGSNDEIFAQTQSGAVQAEVLYF